MLFSVRRQPHDKFIPLTSARDNSIDKDVPETCCVEYGEQRMTLFGNNNRRTFVDAYFGMRVTDSPVLQRW